MDDGSRPLTHCPICRYDLTGLPKDYRCPECAFEYDTSMRVLIGRPARAWEYVRVVFCYLILSGPGWIGLFHPTQLSLAVLAVFWVLLAALPFGAVVCTGHHRQHVVVSDTGIVVTYRLGKPFSRSWAEIWVPDQEGKWFQRPPWVEAKNSELARRSSSRVWAALARERTGVLAKRSVAVYVGAGNRWWSGPLPFRMIGLAVLQELPGKQRKAAMRAIHDRWLAHARPAGDPPPSGSDSV